MHKELYFLYENIAPSEKTVLREKRNTYIYFFNYEMLDEVFLMYTVKVTALR